MKKVSVLIPVYNVEKYIARCLDSIIDQTYDNIEIILVDDCSTDGSAKICNEYAKKDKRIKIIKKETHTVLSDVRNVGIENSKGEYLMFVDGDDYVEKDFVESMVKALEKNSVDAVRCKAIKYKKDGSFTYESFYGNESKVFRGKEIDSILNNFLAYPNNIACYTWALILKKKSVDFKFNSNVYCRQDVVFFIEYLIKSEKSLYFLDKPLYHYCYNENSTTNDSSSYFKYIDGLIGSDDAVKDVLVRYNYMNDDLEKKTNNVVLGIIFYRFHTITNNSIFKMSKIIKETFKKDSVKKRVNNLNKNLLGKRDKLRLFLIKSHLTILVAINEKMKS